MFQNINYSILYGILLFIYITNGDNFAIIDINIDNDNEDDIELIKLKYEKIKPCRFFSDTRHPAIQADLINCTWYKSEACCKRTEVASVFESMFTLHQCSTKCRNMINYMMCFFCDPNQFLWYIKRKVKVCGSFCNQLHKECKNAEYNGNVISVQYKSGKEFCEAQNFQVTSSDCFDFDENVFSKTMSFLKFKSYFLFILQILFCIYII